MELDDVFVYLVVIRRFVLAEEEALKSSEGVNFPKRFARGDIRGVAASTSQCAACRAYSAVKKARRGSPLSEIPVKLSLRERHPHQVAAGRSDSRSPSVLSRTCLLVKLGRKTICRTLCSNDRTFINVITQSHRSIVSEAASREPDRYEFTDNLFNFRLFYKIRFIKLYVSHFIEDLIYLNRILFLIGISNIFY